jgi:hypothetical protein
MTKLALALLAATTITIGCAGADWGGPGEEAPTVLGLSRTAVAVGHSLEIIGGNFLSGAQGHTLVEFEGTFETESGQVSDAFLRFRPHWEDGNRLVWAPIGPFRVPFHPTGDQVGVFEGTLTAINVTPDGAEYGSDPIDVELRILPSIILKDLQPVEAQCTQPSRVLLGGLPYQVGVQAVGFQPVNFSYVMGGEPGSNVPRIIRRKASGMVDEFGKDGEIRFQPVTIDRPFYVATLAVTSLGTDGVERALPLTFGVHNPIEHVLLNRVRVGEIEGATPVSGCMAGGETNGRTVTYSEQTTDTRSRQVGVTWNESWMEQQQNTAGGSTTTTNTFRFDVTESQTEGWEMGWANMTGYEGGFKVGLNKIVQVGFEGKYLDHTTVSRGYYGSSTRGYTAGRDYSVSDTESWAFTQIRGHELSYGGSDFWTVSSSQSTIVSFQGFILPGEYGVFYRQSTRLAIPGVIVAYNLCGQPEVVAETFFHDYTWSVDLAQGNACPPLPKSSLPEAQCFVSPCSSAQ